MALKNKISKGKSNNRQIRQEEDRFRESEVRIERDLNKEINQKI